MNSERYTTQRNNLQVLKTTPHIKEKNKRIDFNSGYWRLYH